MIVLHAREMHLSTEPVVVKRGELHLVNGKVQAHGVSDDDLRFLSRFDIFDRGKRYSWQDGEEWLELLPVHLRGTYFWAEKH